METKNNARNYEYKLVEANGKSIKQRISRNIFGEITRTDNWEFKPITFQVNGESKTVQVVKWAGNDGKESSSVIFDIIGLDDAGRDYFTANGYELTDNYQMEGVIMARPKKKDNSPI